MFDQEARGDNENNHGVNEIIEGMGWQREELMSLVSGGLKGFSGLVKYKLAFQGLERFHLGWDF